MLYETHLSLEANIKLTKNYKTSRAAHQRLDYMVKRECDKAMKINYGLQMLPDTILYLANVQEYQWLLQPELKSIKDGLMYVEDKDCFFNGNEYKYRGYLNAQGQRQGAGILVEIEYYCKHIGEWHEDEPHGITNIEDSDGFSIWGQYRHGS